MLGMESARKRLWVGLAAIAAVSIVSSCVETERVIEAPEHFPKASFPHYTDAVTFERFASVCSGMRPFRSGDTLNELSYHSLYRQKFACKKSYTSEVCPTWILNHATNTCEGPVLLSEVGMGAYSAIEPRLLSDGKMSETARLFYTDVGEGAAYLLESEGAFALVQ